MDDERIGQPVGLSSLLLHMGRKAADTQLSRGDITQDEYDEIIGARMMGGGFGGCVINLVDSVFLKQYVNEISEIYNKMFSLDLTSDIVTISKGLSIR